MYSQAGGTLFHLCTQSQYPGSWWEAGHIDQTQLPQPRGYVHQLYTRLCLECRILWWQLRAWILPACHQVLLLDLQVNMAPSVVAHIFCNCLLPCSQHQIHWLYCLPQFPLNPDSQKLQLCALLVDPLSAHVYEVWSYFQFEPDQL